MEKPKQLCRLCYYETTDIIDIFSENGKQIDLCGKIKKYLYLQAIDTDDLPNSICWMCSQHLETFDRFYSKINEIQRSRLKENYEKIALQAIYKIASNDSKISEEEVIKSDKKNCANTVELEDNVSTLDIKNEKNDAIIFNHTDCLKPKEIRPRRQKKRQPSVTDEIYIAPVRRTRVSFKNEQYINIQESNVKLNVTTVENVSNKQNKQITNTTKLLNKDKIGKELNHELIIPDMITIQNENNEISADKGNHEKELTKQNEIDIYYDLPLKRRRGRSKAPELTAKITETTQTIEAKETLIETKSPIKKSNVIKTPRKKKDDAFKAIHCDIPMHDIDENENEGEQSIDEFPTRDSDDDDWPAQQTLDEFPKEIIKDGLLLLKGQRLMTLICRFYKLKCGLCPKGSQPKFKILRELFLHHLHEHETTGYVECCQTKLSRYPAIIMHMARHLQPSAFKCDECGYVVTRPRFLSTHKQTHLPENLKPYGCDICYRRFCWKGALQVHMISHQAPEDRKQYNCPFCSKVYDTPGGLSTHKNIAHIKAKKNHSNVCHICAKTFSTRTGLNEHMTSIHQPRENSQLQCGLCDKWLMNKRCLKSHMLLHSAVEYECTSCDYKTKKRELLKRHTVTQHSDLKPFKCHCGKTFKLKRALTVHKKNHIETKTFTCTFCPKTFNSSTNFYTHRKNAHPMELEEMKRQSLEQQREKRIKAGIEFEPEPDYVSIDDPLDGETVLYEIIIPSKTVKCQSSNSDDYCDDGENDNAAVDKETYHINVSINDDEEKDDNDDDEAKNIEIIAMNEDDVSINNDNDFDDDEVDDGF